MTFGLDFSILIFMICTQGKIPCNNKSCEYWFPFSGWNHCLKNYARNYANLTNRNIMSDKEIALLYKLPKSKIKEDYKKAKQALIFQYLKLNYKFLNHKIEFVQKAGICSVCGSFLNTELNSLLCLGCFKYENIILLEKQYQISAREIYNNLDILKTYTKIKTSEKLWNDFFKLKEL